MIERTLVVIKPDGVQRALVGKILQRFEDAGLKVAGLKMLIASNDIASKHYQVTEEWAKGVYEKAKKGREALGEKFPFNDHLEYANMIQSWNRNYLMEGPVVAIALEGPHAVEIGRKMSGNTEPRQASPGTIRGDFAFDSYANSNNAKRSLRNLVHSSGTTEEAAREIALWFSQHELFSYKSIHDFLHK